MTALAAETAEWLTGLALALDVVIRGGFGSGGSGIGQNCCPSVENKLTDNPSVNRPLIGSGGRVG